MSEQTTQEIPDFEHYPPDMRKDETDVAIRAYLDKFSDEKVAEYDPAWTDDQILEWDENWRSDGNLMLVCCERDVDVIEYRKVLEELIEYRKKYPSTTGE